MMALRTLLIYLCAPGVVIGGVYLLDDYQRMAPGQPSWLMIFAVVVLAFFAGFHFMKFLAELNDKGRRR